MVEAACIDNEALHSSLKKLKKVGGLSVVAKFHGWHRGLGGGSRSGGYRASRHLPLMTGRSRQGGEATAPRLRWDGGSRGRDTTPPLAGVDGALKGAGEGPTWAGERRMGTQEGGRSAGAATRRT